MRAISFVHQIVIFAVALALRPLIWILSKPPSNTAYIVASDAQTLIGAKGDEAMLVASVRWISERDNDTHVFVSCADALAANKASAMGLNSFRVWGRYLMPMWFWLSVRRDRPGLAIVIGADIMDGYYSPVESLRRVIAADLLSRCGAKTMFTGFSFSGTSNGILKLAYRLLHQPVRVALRDPVSDAVFKRDVGTRSSLVADVAFLLKPRVDPNTADVAAWIAVQRKQGRTVCAVNIHPLLFKGPQSAQQILELERRLVHAMGVIAQQRSVSWLLFPHDDRPEIGDLASLSRVMALVGAESIGHAYLLPRPPSAAAIKELVGHVDAVVTGRMHLAIAALGSGVPIMAFAYQAKFSGLLQHFELPDWLLLQPDRILSEPVDALNLALLRFIDSIPQLRAQVDARRPTVYQLALKNFAQAD
jgi:colanic acid/amylovoran biosynthesis protein